MGKCGHAKGCRPRRWQLESRGPSIPGPVWVSTAAGLWGWSGEMLVDSGIREWESCRGGLINPETGNPWACTTCMGDSCRYYGNVRCLSVLLNLMGAITAGQCLRGEGLSGWRVREEGGFWY